MIVVIRLDMRTTSTSTRVNPMMIKAVTPTASALCVCAIPENDARRLGCTAHKFTGKERDAESNLDMFGARYYGSSLGRFMTPDWSSKPEPVPYADFENPQSLNQYSYSGNNPSSKSDPDGHCDVDGEHHWGWCIWHTLGLYETQVDRVNDARNFFNNNDVTIGGNHVDPSKMTDQQVLAAFKQYNDAYRAAGGDVSPNGALAALLQ